MKCVSIVLATVVVTVCMGADAVTATDKEMATWEPLWANGVPDKVIVHKDPLKVTDKEKKGTGEPYRAENVGVPAIKLFPAPKETATGAAVVVFPGGGYRFISVGPEGYTIARKLNSLGISAAVVMYRTLPADANGRIAEATWKAGLGTVLADGRQAVRIVRSRASELGADPNKIGVMGFSAGGHLCSMLMVDGQAASADGVSSRPDFTCLIYAGFDEGFAAGVQPGIGPCFMAIAGNDRLCSPLDNMELLAALQKAKVPAELHVFQSGGHGFNVGKTRGTESTWPDVFAVWLKQNGFSRK